MPLVFRYYYGTFEGGKKAATTNKAKYGDSFYANIGRRGGQNGHTGGFAADPERAKRAGRLGGLTSRRGNPILPLEVRRENARLVVEQDGEQL